MIARDVGVRELREVAARLYNEVVALTADVAAAREQARVTEQLRREAVERAHTAQQEFMRGEREREQITSFGAIKQLYLRLRDRDVDGVLHEMARLMVTPPNQQER